MIIKLKSFIRRTAWYALLLCVFPISTSCENLDSVISEDEVKIAIDQFNTLYNNTQNAEAFLFFSDPHLLSGENRFTPATKRHLDNSFGFAKELYDVLPLSFCLCGGDWLNQRDTQDMAKEKLLYADRLMKSKFGRYYKMMGNHDTNYLGYVSTDNDQRGDLPREFIDNEYFSDTGSAYYTFDGVNTRFFILDSGLDWNTAMDDYRWEQILWLAEQLEVTELEHIVIGIHIFYYIEEKIAPMSELIVRLCDAYNSKLTITLKEREFDYTMAKGKIHFILSGHNHRDGLNHEGQKADLPVIQICNYTINESQSFDLCLIDYDKGFFNMIRVGEGENRSVKMN